MFFCLTELEKRPQPQQPRSSEELEDLQKQLYFPEEVALRLTEVEYQLFYQVPPNEFLRHVSQDFVAQHRKKQKDQQQQQHTGLTTSSTQTEDEDSWPIPTASVSVQTLIDRFTEVLYINHYYLY